jgi:hypothetical protein
MSYATRPAAAAGGALFYLIACCAAAAAAPCDADDPSGPSLGAQITLDASDFASERHEALQSFVATGSLGRVTARVVSSQPGGIVRGVTASPQTNRLSQLPGEALEGVEVVVTLRRPYAAPRVVIELRQVCAQYFRNTFLY